MKPAVKLLSVALLFTFGAIGPLAAADRFDPAPRSAFNALPDTASGSQHHAFFAASDGGRFNAAGFDADPAPGHARLPASVPKHRTWMTLLAGVGLVVLLLGRIKRRFS